MTTIARINCIKVINKHIEKELTWYAKASEEYGSDTTGSCTEYDYEYTMDTKVTSLSDHVYEFVKYTQISTQTHHTGDWVKYKTEAVGIEKLGEINFLVRKYYLDGWENDWKECAPQSNVTIENLKGEFDD